MPTAIAKKPVRRGTTTKRKAIGVRKVPAPIPVSFDREVHSQLFNPGRFDVQEHTDKFGQTTWTVRIVADTADNTILVGTLDYPPPRFSFVYSEGKYSVRVRQSRGHLLVVRSIYGKSRRGWKNDPILSFESPLIPEIRIP